MVKVLKLFPGICLTYLSPPGLRLPEEVFEEVRAHGVSQEYLPDLAQATARAHVLYMTRIQKERFASQEEYAAATGLYRLEATHLEKARRDMVVMHPLPRVDEISPEVDSDPRAAYIRQMENGMYMRMALLDTMINH